LARPEPPGRLHTSTGTPYEECRPACAARRSRRLTGSLRGLFSHGLGGSFTNRSPGLLPSRPFKPRSFRTSHEPRHIFTAIAVADMTRRQAKVCLQPLIYQADQSPLAPFLVQAPKTVVPLRRRRGPFVGLGEVMLSLALANFHTISFFLTDTHAASWARCVAYLVTYANATWRQAKVCLRPLPSYGEDRASRPPPLQHRVPIRAASALDLSSVSVSVSLIRISPGLFQSQVRRPFGSRRKRLNPTRVV